jgi:hypothetical protein
VEKFEFCPDFRSLFFRSEGIPFPTRKGAQKCGTGLYLAIRMC